MAKSDFRLDGEHQDRFQTMIIDFFDWFSDPKNSKSRKTLISAILVVVAGVVFYGYTNHTSNVKNVGFQETLGQAAVYQEQGESVKAKETYTQFLANAEVNGVYRAKAALLLGDIFYYENDLKNAEANYTMALKNAGESDLISSGAEHGLAAVKIQSADYAGAAQSLEAFISKWGLRKTAYVAGQVDDKVFQVPEALVQLGLVYIELGEKDKAKTALEKVMNVYSDSRQAQTAKKIAASI